MKKLNDKIRDHCINQINALIYNIEMSLYDKLVNGLKLTGHIRTSGLYKDEYFVTSTKEDLDDNLCGVNYFRKELEKIEEDRKYRRESCNAPQYLKPHDFEVCKPLRIDGVSSNKIIDGIYSTIDLKRHRNIDDDKLYGFIICPPANENIFGNDAAQMEINIISCARIEEKLNVGVSALQVHEMNHSKSITTLNRGAELPHSVSKMLDEGRGFIGTYHNTHINYRPGEPLTMDGKVLSPEYDAFADEPTVRLLLENAIRIIDKPMKNIVADINKILSAELDDSFYAATVNGAVRQLKENGHWPGIDIDLAERQSKLRDQMHNVDWYRQHAKNDTRNWGGIYRKSHEK